VEVEATTAPSSGPEAEPADAADDKSGPFRPRAERSCARVPTCRQALCSVVAMPARGVTLGFKYFDEFSNESTFEGGSLQISFPVNLK